jgi:hypothetical protein
MTWRLVGWSVVLGVLCRLLSRLWMGASRCELHLLRNVPPRPGHKGHQREA